MPRLSSPDKERQLITSQIHKRPYGAKVVVHVQTAGAFGQVESEEIQLATGAIITLAPDRIAPWLGGRNFVLKLEGFPTAIAASAAAKRLVQALLWMAISSDAPLRLDYQGSDPFVIFERGRSDGVQVSAYSEGYFQPDTIFNEIKTAYIELDEPDPRLLLSMEIFAGARLEASNRARFLAIVSALEPLANPQNLGPEVDHFVMSCLDLLKSTTGLNSRVQNSLHGRVEQLCDESIRQAVRRVVEETLPAHPDAFAVIDEAYALRSQLLHSGRLADDDTDLEQVSLSVSNILRYMYASILDRNLIKPPTN